MTRTENSAYGIASDNGGPASVWLMVAAGLLIAGFAADSWCGSPVSLTRSRILSHCLGYVAFTCLAGASGVRLMWQLLPSKPLIKPSTLSIHLLPGWVFFPSIVLLVSLASPWAFAVLALATIAVSASLLHLFPRVELASTDPHESELLRTIYGLPKSDARLLLAFGIAIGAQASFIFACTGLMWFAVIAFSISLSLLVWNWSLPTSMFAGRKARAATVLLALLLTAFAQLPWMADDMLSRRLFGPPLHRPAPSLVPTSSHSSGYVGVFLLPPVKKTKEIPPPPSPVSSAAASIRSRSLVIPFNGRYWYFKAPYSDPGLKAHIAHGLPTEGNIDMHSTDARPLLMEAHQELGTAIDLPCCSAIDLSIVNAETRPGRIVLGLRLTDTISPGKPSILLGMREVVSSRDKQIPAHRPAVEEVLHFPFTELPTNAPKLRRFDEMTVIFQPSVQQSRYGVRMGVQSFKLVAR